MRRLPRIADKKQLHDAARVAAGVCILTSVGIIAWTYGSKQGLPYLEHAAQGLQWGAITVLLVSYPVVGRTARTGVERALGTIAGGVLGFFTSWAAEGALWCVLGFVIPFTGYLWGARSGYEYAGKLFSVTWAIVAPIATHPGTHPLVIFVARVGGILAGIATTFVLACILWPRSASDEVVDHLSASMSHLQQLTELTWGALQLSRQHHEQQTLLEVVCDALVLPVPTALAHAGSGDMQPRDAAVPVNAVDMWKDAAAAVVADGTVAGAGGNAAKEISGSVPETTVAANGTALTAAMLLDGSRQYGSSAPGAAESSEACDRAAAAAAAAAATAGGGAAPTGAVVNGQGHGYLDMDSCQQQQQPPTAVGHVLIDVLPLTTAGNTRRHTLQNHPPSSIPAAGGQAAAVPPFGVLPAGLSPHHGTSHARGPSSPSIQQLPEPQAAAVRPLQRRVVSLQDLRVLGEPEWLHAANPGSLASVAQWLQTQPSGAVPASPAPAGAAGGISMGPGIGSNAPSGLPGYAVTAGAAAGTGGVPLGPPPTPAAAAAAGDSRGLKRAGAPMEPLQLPPAAVAIQTAASGSNSSSSNPALAVSGPQPALAASVPVAAERQFLSDRGPTGLADDSVAAVSSAPQPFVGVGSTGATAPVSAPPAAASVPAIAGAVGERRLQSDTGVQASAPGASAAICSSSQLAARQGRTHQQEPGADPSAACSRPQVIDHNCSSATATPGAAPALAHQPPGLVDSLPHVSLQIPILPPAAIWDPFAAVAGHPLTSGGDASTAGRDSVAFDASAHQQSSAAGASPPPAGACTASLGAGLQAGRAGSGLKGSSEPVRIATAAAAAAGAAVQGNDDVAPGHGAVAPAAIIRRRPTNNTAAAGALAGGKRPSTLQHLEIQGSPAPLLHARRSSGAGSEPPSTRPSRAASSRPAALLSTLSGALSWALPRQLSLPVGAAGIVGRSSGSFTPGARPPTLQEAAEVLSAECPSDDATVLESLVAAAGGERQADEVVTPGQRAQIRSTLDARCEELVFGVHREVNAVKDCLTHARSELYVGMARNHRWYLPLLLLPGQERRRPHMPEAQVQRLGLAMRRAGRLTWALHLALMDGFDEHITAVLRARFPAQLLDKLHLAAVALLRDAAAAMAACKRGCSCQAAFEALPVMRRHLAQYNKLLNTLLEISEQQRHQIVDHVRRYVLPPPQHEEDSPASMSARFSFDDPAVDEAGGGAGSRRRTFGERLLRAASATTPGRALRRSVSSRGPRRSSAQGAGEECRRLLSGPVGASPLAVAVQQPSRAPATAEAPRQSTAAADTHLTQAAQLLMEPAAASGPAQGVGGTPAGMPAVAAAVGVEGQATAAELARGFGSTWHLAGADGDQQGSPALQHLPGQEYAVNGPQSQQGRVLTSAGQHHKQQQQQQLEGLASRQPSQHEQQQRPQQQAGKNDSTGPQQAEGMPWIPPLHIPARPPLLPVEEAATAAAVPQRVSGGGDGDKGATPLSPQPSSVDTLLPGALPHVDTPRLFFPDTREGYLGKMRWYSFKFLLEQLAEQYVELVEALADLVPRLPGNTVEQQPQNRQQ